MIDPVIEIKNLSYSYGRGLVLENVNLSIARGEYVACLGPNGGGKSTLLKIMAGILPPQKGEVHVLGRKLPGRLEGVGYVPQEVSGGGGLPATVEDVVLMGLLRAGLMPFNWSRADRRAAAEALEWVGMSEHIVTPISKLSGGQRQRVYIARALASKPSLLLLDEPTSGVDKQWQARLFILLEELNRTMTILMVSHDLNVISTHVKSVACVNRSVFFHPSPEITPRMIQETYACPVELVAHGMPHRVLGVHEAHSDSEKTK